MEFRILGPLEALESGEPVPLGGARQRALLALLLTRPNEVVPSERLVDELWEEPPRAARNVLQTYVSHLRKVLRQDVLLTRAPGYLLAVEPGQLDLDRFEQLFELGRSLLEQGDAESAARELRSALVLWRGPPLADFSYERFAQATIARLEELRRVALEWRIDADLALGRHDSVVGELEQLVAEYPLRERPRSQLMLALYRDGRQADALACYQDGRRTLVEQLGIEPGHSLQELEKAILQQSPELDLPVEGSSSAERASDPSSGSFEEQASTDRLTPDRSILVAPSGAAALGALLEIAEPIARKPRREIILARLLADDVELGETIGALRDVRDSLETRDLHGRVAAFTSPDPGRDLARMATEQDVDLLLLDASDGLARAELADAALRHVLEAAPCDVALVSPRGHRSGRDHASAPIFVPFGGSDNDWAAVEIGAWIAASRNASLRLLGTRADAGESKRDASRLLASVSLMIQQVTGVIAEPLLISPGPDGVIDAAREAQLIVVGLSDDWRQRGIGDARAAMARNAAPPVMLIRGGLRPGGLAPDHTLTRFTWSMASEQI